MYALYMERWLKVCSVATGKSISDIHKEVPNNTHQSFVEWLDKYFAPYSFARFQYSKAQDAAEKVKFSINRGFPLLISTNHVRTSGHIILAIGYISDASPTGNGQIDFVCHDPYGKFNPELKSDLYGKRRLEGGACLVTGGEQGPGAAVIYDSTGIERARDGTWVLITAK